MLVRLRIDELGKLINEKITVGFPDTETYASQGNLFGGFGEVRLGRDYIPTFWNLTIFDAFGTNGLGSSATPRQLYGGTRTDNSIGYFLPANLGGFYGQAMVAAAEGGTTLERPARYIGARVGFAAGPFDVAFAGATQRFSTAFPTNTVAAGGLAVRRLHLGGRRLRRRHAGSHRCRAERTGHQRPADTDAPAPCAERGERTERRHRHPCRHVHARCCRRATGTRREGRVPR